MTILQLIVIGLVAGIASYPVAKWLGAVAGVYEAGREETFRRRAIKILSRNGRAQKFLIISGDPQLVDELYEVTIATTARAQKILEDQHQANKEGIAVNDKPKEQDTE